MPSVLVKLHPVVRGDALPSSSNAGISTQNWPFRRTVLSLKFSLRNVRGKSLRQCVPLNCHPRQIPVLAVRREEIGKGETECGNDLFGRAPDKAMQQDGAVLVFPDAQGCCGCRHGQGNARSLDLQTYARSRAE